MASEDSRTITFLSSRENRIPTGPLGRLTQMCLTKNEADAVVKGGCFVLDTTSVTTSSFFAINATSYQVRKSGIQRLRDSSVCEFKNGSSAKFGSISILKEGPIAMLDVLAKLPESILETLTVSDLYLHRMF